MSIPPFPVSMILSLLPVPLFIMSAYLYFKSRENKDLKMVQIVQPLSTVLVIVSALLCFFGPNLHFEFAVLIILGLVASLFADLVLVELGSLIVFAIGFIFFTIAISFYSVAMFKFTDIHITHLIPGIPMLLVSIYAFIRMSRGKDFKGPVKIFVALYTLIFMVLVTMCWGSLISGDLPFIQALFMSIGTTLFYFADFQLAINTFEKPDSPFWKAMIAYGAPMYAVGQMFIALSLTW